MVARRQHGDRRGRLGQPVRVHEPGPGEDPQRPLQDRPRGPRPAVGQAAQRRRARVAAADLGHDPGQHRRHDERVRDPLPPHGPQPLRGVERRQVHHAAPGVEVRQQARQPGDVVRRHRDQRRVALPGRPELDRVQHVREQVPVPQHGGLGLGGRPACIQERGDRVLLVRERCRGAVVTRIPRRGHARRSGRAGRAQQSVEIALAEYQGPGMTPHKPVELGPAEPVVDRNERHPGQRRPEQGDRVREMVGAQVQDRRIVPEPPGGALGEPQDLRRGQPPVARRDHRPVACRGRHLQDHR
jgi:hypothetical protein